MISCATLLAVVVMQAPIEAPAAPGFRLAATASASGGFFRQYGAIDGQAAALDLALDWYLRRPVVDDGRSLAAAPYLQRLDRLSVGFDGTWLKAQDGVLGGEQRGFSVEAWLSALWYRQWAVWGAQAEYARADGRELSAETGAATPAEKGTVQRVRPSVTFGVRDGNFELRGTYSWSAYFDVGAFRSPTWGQVEALARLLLDDRNDLSLSACSLGRGAGVSGTYQFFASPRTRLWLRGTYEGGEIYNRTDVWHQYDYEHVRFQTFAGPGATDDSGYLAEAGIGYWPSPRFELRFWASGGVVSFATVPRDEPDQGDVAYGDTTVIKQFLLHIGGVVRARKTR